MLKLLNSKLLNSNSRPNKNILAEGIRILYRQPINVSIVQLIIAVTIFFFTYSTITFMNHLWLAVILVIYILRLYMIRQFNSNERSDDDALRWGRYYTYTALVTGTVWGCSVFIFTSTYGITLAVLCSLVGLICIGAIVATSFWLEGYFAFIIPALILVSIKLFLSDQAFIIALGVTTILFLLGLIIYGRISNKLTLDAISYKFKNLDIIEQLEKANSAKSRFFASANHDLRQPINSLNLIANSLAAEPQSHRSEALIENLGITLSRLDHLLDSLLDISSIDSGSIDYQVHACSLEQVFKTLLIEHLDECRSKNLELRIRPSKHWVFTDEIALDRILSNLVNNAIKYTQNGGVLVACRKHGDNQVCIEVWDTGTGIEQDQLEHIFEEFYQVNNHARNNNDGLGLGLPICRLLAEQLGHKLFVKSRIGRGTVFSLLVEKTDARKLDVHTNKPISYENTKQVQHVLLVEDDDMGRTVLADLLRQRGVQVTTAIDLVSAIAACATITQDIDLVISDYRLPPPANGIKVIDQIRMHNENDKLAAILISGDLEPDLSASKTVGDIHFVSKPINIEVLTEKIQQLSN